MEHLRNMSKLGKFIAARLTPEGELGLHLTLGVLSLAGAVWLFGGIAEEVMGADKMTDVDAQVAQWFHAHATSGLTRFMLAVTYLHSSISIGVLSALLGTYFYMSNARYWLLSLVVAVPGGMLLNVLLKHIFTRSRPTFSNPILTLYTYSFPSGHTAAATLFYGIIASYLVCLTRDWGTRSAIVAGAVLMVLLVGMSRLYLGVHFLSDVLAAMVESCAWLSICITASSTLRRHRAAGRGQQQRGSA